jgi:hypothetical protein
MKHFYKIIFLFFILLSFEASAQNYANDWINYNQSYYKIKVWNNGVYRINYNTLVQTIPEITNVDPRSFQIFGRGEEQHIYVEGESDGIFNEGDFVEFYGQRNDGYFDTQLYPNQSDQTNKFHSLFTDTTVYFLTWNTGIENKRFTLETANNYNDFGAAASWFWRDVIFQNTNNYHFGRTNAINSTDPEYTNAEGWSGPNIAAPQNNVATNIPSPQAFTSGPAAFLEIYYKTVSNAAHKYVLTLGNTVIDTSMQGHGTRRFSFSLPASQVGAANTVFRFSYPSTPGVTSNSVFSNYRFRYAHNFNMEGLPRFEMHLPDNPDNTKYFLNMTNFATANTPVWIFDLTTKRKIAVEIAGTNRRALVPNSANGSIKHLFMTNEAQIVNVSTLSPVNHNSSQPAKFNDLRNIVGAEYLIVTHRSLLESSNAYAAYRSSKFSTKVVTIEELYDQFSHGILKHPYSIRNFATLALGEWEVKPEFLLLIGKSVSPQHIRTNVNNFAQCLVPTFGFPSSDILFTNGLGDATMWEPGIATGRIAANNPQDVNAYLNKVIDYESQIPAMWMKQIIHFGGGQSTTEQAVYMNYLNRYKAIIEDTLFGGSVFTYQKTSSAPIEETQSALVASYINNGVSLMTFFGHATGSGFDVSIDNPANYNNTGKYPFLIANSCLAGDIHQPAGSGFSTSEEFVLIPNKGTIGFIASVGLGIPFQLHVYSDTLYNKFGNKMYGQSMGKCMKSTVRAIQSMDQFRKATVLETTLHGDPAVVLNAHRLPDYAVDQQSVYFNPDPVTTEIDSFMVNVIVKNLGMAINKPLTVEVKRTFPVGNNPKTYNLIMNPVLNQDTLKIKMPVDLVNGVGLNTIAVKLDPLNEIEEMLETNNEITVPLLIRSAVITPIWPYNYALIPGPSVTLKASTGDPFAPARNYLFELDTTDLFNSPFKKETVINQTGGVVNWVPPITLQDSMVYFWRVSPEPISGGEFFWREHSFQYINGKRGWSQDHFFQFKNNNFNLINYQRPQRYFDFVTNAKLLTCNAFGFPWTASELWATSYKIDAEVWADAGCSLDPAIYIAVIDSVSLIPWLSPANCFDQGNQFGQFNSNCACKSGNRMANFIFRTNRPAELAAMRDMLNNHIPNGNYVLAYSWIMGNYQNWDPSVIEAFENLGADSIRYLPNEYPYIFFTKKGHPSTKVELIADSANADLQLQVPMYNSWVSGDFTSTLIGPGKYWDSLSWKAKNFDNPDDLIQLQVKGIKPNGMEDIIIPSLSYDSTDISLVPYIEGKDYKYIKLNAFMRDDSLRTPVQLDRWQVTYEPVPEAALNPIAGFHFFKDTLQQGQKLQLAISIENISELPMDSMLVKYWIQDAARNDYPVEYTRQKPLLPADILYDTLHVPVLPFSGPNTIWVEANPDNDQPEQYHFNNIGSYSFYVDRDNINPILDVTFDGIHILNGDIVSPSPDILIRLKDENPYLVLDDTSSFRIYLKKPSEQAAIPVYFANQEVLSFFPAELPTNKARVEYRPRFTEDGKYSLIVRAKDRSDNASANTEYKIDFEVINRSTITEVLNWPNPFSTRTHFVFTLTGNEIPDDFRIQIMSVSGKVVREIMREELGPIRIGRNITEYAWNGRDEFGDQLANGVYLYRVLTTIKGESIERRETNADQYFKKGFGKMYLMR